MTRISVVIPFHNRSQFIHEAMAGVLGQTGPATEVVIVDDGSRPDEAAHLGRYVECARIVTQRCQGAAAARNAGVAAATGEWIAFLDDDDLWDLAHLRNVSEYLAVHPECDVVHTAVRQETGEIYRKSELVLRDFLFGHPCPAYTSSVVIRRSTLLLAGMMNPAIRGVEDTDCFTRVAILAKFHYVDQPTVVRRRHSGNISAQLRGACIWKNRIALFYRHLYPSEPERLRFLEELNAAYMARAIYQRDWAAAWETVRQVRLQGASVAGLLHGTWTRIRK
jgi:glycosyltransferase involved in cell wall biosynthesis